jgi:hypothetical protein
MYLINNKPFVSFDNVLDIALLKDLVPEISLAIAKNTEYIAAGSTDQNTLLDQNLKSFQNVKTHYGRHPEQYPTDFNNKQIETYLKLNKCVTLTQRLNLCQPLNYFKKHLALGCLNQPYIKDFKFLIDWIDAQDCFEERGRIVFFISEAGATGIAHKDYNGSSKDMFIWITNPLAPKTIKLVDEATRIRHDCLSLSSIFDARQYHETINTTPWTTWSLRIDGVFKKEWAIKAGIYEQYAVEINNYLKS